MPPKKTNERIGLEMMLNNKSISPFVNPQAFREIFKASEMPINQTLKYIGLKSKTSIPVKSEKDKAEERLQKLENETERA